MPTIATRSLMPLLAIVLSFDSALGARLPEVVADAAGREDPPERHLDLVADLHLLGLAVGHLAEEAAAALVVDDHRHRRRVQGEGEAVERVGRDARLPVRERVGLHLVPLAALHAHALGRELRRAAGGAL